MDGVAVGDGRRGLVRPSFESWPVPKDILARTIRWESARMVGPVRTRPKEADGSSIRSKPKLVRELINAALKGRGKKLERTSQPH